MTGPRFRPNNPSRWRAGVLIAVHVAILLHLAHWLTSGTTVGAFEPSEAMELPKHGVVTVGLLVLIGGALTTAVFGRFFCGWACHVIALQDLSRWLLLKVGVRPRPLRSRTLRWVPYLAFGYMFLWPVGFRLLDGTPLPGITASLTTSDLWANMPGWVVGIATLLVVGCAAVYVLGAKGFCTYACPYGALMRVVEPLAPLRIRVTDACRGCAQCTAACTSNVRVHEHVRDWGMVRDNDCMKCLDCVAACPNDALYLGFGAPALGSRPRVDDPPPARPWNVAWGEEGLLVLAFVATFLTLRGLYGAVPFLLSLGASASVAYLLLVAVRLVTRPDVRFAGHRLKRAGRGTIAGRVYAAVIIVLLVVLGHSAVIRYNEATAASLFENSVAVRAQAMDLQSAPATLAGEDRRLVDQLLNSTERVRSLGLFENPRLHLPRAWALFLVVDLAGANEAVEAALEVQPGEAEVHRLRGRLLVEQGRHREAVLAYAQAVELAPDRPEGFLFLGSLLGAIGDVDRAREVFRRGLTAFPDHADLAFNLGVAAGMKGDAAAAVAAFEKVLERHPEHRKARENLVGMLVSAGRANDAESMVRSELRETPDDADYRFLLARVLLARGDSISATEELQRCLALDPELSAARDLLTRLGGSVTIRE